MTLHNTNYALIETSQQSRSRKHEYLANALTAGIVLGAKVPIVLTSRADTAETRMASCVIATLIAHNNRNKALETE